MVEFVRSNTDKSYVERCPSWSKEHDWKSCSGPQSSLVGSNPTRSAMSPDPPANPRTTDSIITPVSRCTIKIWYGSTGYGSMGVGDGMAEKVVTFHTESAGETERLGERIGSALEPGIVVALTGDLGAGKTTLTKGIARGLGVSDLIHSPTFTLIHEHKGRLPLYHFDLYRLDSPEQLDDLGYEDYFYSDGVSIVEWSEKAQELLPPDHLEIRITGDDDQRTFGMRATGPDSEHVLAGIT